MRMKEHTPGAWEGTGLPRQEAPTLVVSPMTPAVYKAASISPRISLCPMLGACVLMNLILCKQAMQASVLVPIRSSKLPRTAKVNKNLVIIRSH